MVANEISIGHKIGSLDRVLNKNQSEIISKIVIINATSYSQQYVYIILNNL